MTRRQDTTSWALALVMTGVGWYLLAREHPVAGAYFAGLAVSGVVICWLLRNRLVYPMRGDDGNGGRGPDDDDPVTPTPGPEDHPVDREVAAYLQGSADAMAAMRETVR